MNIANQIREANLKLRPGNDPEEPINEEKLLIDCMIQGSKIDEGIFLFKDNSVIDTIDFRTSCYKSLVDYFLKNNK